MSRRQLFTLTAFLGLAIQVAAQCPANPIKNGPEIFNGTDIIYYFTDPSVGNVPGSGVFNTTTADQLFFQNLPKELMYASNGTSPPTMTFVGQEVSVYYTYWNGGGLPSVYDQALYPVTYPIDPATSLPDGRRVPDLAQAPLFVLLGGPLALPPPTSCPGTAVAGYDVSFEYAFFDTATGCTTPAGIPIPADGVVEHSMVAWFPGGMSFLPADPTSCEIGGNFTFMFAGSTNEKLPIGITTTNRNPFSGFRGGATATPNNMARTAAAKNFMEFREPFLVPQYTPYDITTAAFFPIERGSGSMYQDLTLMGTIMTGVRTQAVGKSGQLAIHLMSFLPDYIAPGIIVTPTSYLIIDILDPNAFILTPLLDTVVAANTTDYVQTKDVADTVQLPLVSPLIATVHMQSFIVDFISSPPVVESSNRLSMTIQ